MSENVLDDISKEGIISCIGSKTLGEWECSDPKKRIAFEESNGKSGSKSDMLLKKDLPKSVKMKLKGGGFVDPVRNQLTDSLFFVLTCLIFHAYKTIDQSKIYR